MMMNRKKTEPRKGGSITLKPEEAKQAAKEWGEKMKAGVPKEVTANAN